MTNHELTNTRFAALRTIAGLNAIGAYEVRSNGLMGRYDVIGRTDDVRLACKAAKALEAHAVPCETFTANEAV